MDLIKKFRENTPSQIILLSLTGLLLGFLIITQSRYYTSYVSSVGRDSSENIFRKIQMLKTSNDELSEEITSLEAQLKEVSNQALALESIDKDIKKNQMISGEATIFGPGIEFIIETGITDIWFTDITNELWAAGAEAVSVNGIRLTDTTAGFDKLPNGQIMINNVILTAPYTFNAIGEKSNLKQSIEVTGGILERLKSTYQDFKFSITQKDRIEISRV